MNWRIAHFTMIALLLAFCAGGYATQAASAEPVAPDADRPDGLQRLKYNHPGLVVDLGVGLWAWPLPMDYDGDGDHDLVVSCRDVPYNGTYFFENTSGRVKFPVFKPGVRLGEGLRNVQVSHVSGEPRVTVPGYEYADFLTNGLSKKVKLPAPVKVQGGKLRANQWKYADYDGDGRTDLVIGIGDWTDYGWDNAFDAQGKWTRGPLHGWVYLLRNRGSDEKPEYEEPVKIEAAGEPIDVFGMPSPNLADFDGDGDLDILCGEFVDTWTWFENTGTRTEPKYAAGRHLMHDGAPLRVDLCMHVPSAIDWDFDGDVDLVVGQEDGRVALVENTGKMDDGVPVFLPPRFFQQEADELKFGALVTPVGFDWDDDGDDDLVCGNTAGYIGWIENLDGGDPPKWAAPEYIEADGQTIRIEAGYNGSIQGPCEAKWGYTTLSVADWDHNGLPDLVVNSIWGKVVWYRNVGTRSAPKLTAAGPVRVEWPGKPPKPAWNWWDPKPKELATQWRTTPLVIDLTGDGLNDLVMLDHEGYLALFERKKVDGKLRLMPPTRVFTGRNGSVFSNRHDIVELTAGPLRLNSGEAGKSGRRKLCFADWDGDGRPDLLVNSRSIDLLRNEGIDQGKHVFRNAGSLDSRVLAGHTTSPTVVDWDGNGVPDLVVGGEDGCLYYMKNPHAKTAKAARRPPNFVLFLVDDLGWMDLGCYGSTFYETPNTDRLAREGMRFTDAYAACPVCSPTRAALMSGQDTARVQFTGHITAIGRHRYPEHGRIIPPEDRMYLALQEVTIAEALKPAGYVSASIGKWHLGSEEYYPEHQGFDLNVAGFTHGSPPSHFYPYENAKTAWRPNIPTLRGGKPGEYLTDRLTDEAVAFIEANRNKPWLLYLPHYAVHTPLEAPEPLVQKYREKLKTDSSQKSAVYGAMVDRVDWSLGRIVDTLARLGLEDNTIIIFTSDNGGYNDATDNAPLREGKGFLYEGGIRVPLIVKWPGSVQSGSVCREPVTSEDLYPTMVQIAGPPAHGGRALDGRSLVPLLTGEGTFERGPLYWYYPHYSPQARQPGAAVRDGDYKLIEHYDPPKVELYDLAADLGERNDLAEKMPQKAEELLEKLHAFLKSVDGTMHTLNPDYRPEGVR